MWIKANPNPDNQEVPDCVVRAISIATNQSWDDVYWDLCKLGGVVHNMPSADAVWGKYLYDCGFEPFLLPASCPRCTTIRTFSEIYKRGTYIIGTGSHAVAIINGNYFDSWDSGNEVPSFFWKIK